MCFKLNILFLLLKLVKIIPISSIQKNKNINLIVEGIKDKKGSDITIIDFDNILNSPCSFFIICSANSLTQINAISTSIEKILFEKMNLKLWKDEGKNTNWRLLDYFDIVIHIFHKETRIKYKLEELWGDGKTINY